MKKTFTFLCVLLLLGTTHFIQAQTCSGPQALIFDNPNFGFGAILQQTVINVPISPVATIQPTVTIEVNFCGDFNSAGENLMLEDETMTSILNTNADQCQVTTSSFTITQAQYNQFVADGFFTVTVVGNSTTGACGAGCDFVELCFPVIETAPVPTLSEWGLMIFGLLIVNLSVVTLRRKEELLA